MYKKSITELPTAGPLNGDEYVAIVQDGRTKKVAIGEGLSGRVITGDEPPAEPYEGQLWFSTIKNRLYSWNVGASSSQWVQV